MKPNLKEITDEGYVDSGVSFADTCRIYKRGKTDRIIYDTATDDVFLRYEYELGVENGN